MGDVVWSSNPETGQSGWKIVSNTFINDKSSVWELTFADEEQQATVQHRVTGEHPYWVLSNGSWSWKAVSELEAGMIVETKSGKTLTVVGTHDTEVVKRTYNFEVEDFHTYYVGDEEILVHNTCKKKLNRLDAHPKAEGNHTVWKTDSDGNITRHETFEVDPQNPRTGFKSKQSTDLVGKPHAKKPDGELVPTPHTQGRDIPGGVRSATPDEIPKPGNYDFDE